MSRVEWVEMSSQVALVDHTHKTTHILVVLDGEIREDGRVYRSGDIRVSSADDRHFLRFAQPTSCLIIEGAVRGAPLVPRRVLRLPELIARLREVTDAEQAIDLVTRPDVLEDRSGPEKPPWLRELESRRIEGKFVRSTTVDEIARWAGVSREHLTRSYHRHFGTSFSDAIRARRLREAYDALTASALPLADLADACGFSDQSHMTRQFVDWIGRTPGALRRNMRNVTSVQDGLAAHTL